MALCCFIFPSASMLTLSQPCPSPLLFVPLRENVSVIVMRCACCVCDLQQDPKNILSTSQVTWVQQILLVPHPSKLLVKGYLHNMDQGIVEAQVLESLPPFTTESGEAKGVRIYHTRLCNMKFCNEPSIDSPRISYVCNVFEGRGIAYMETFCQTAIPRRAQTHSFLQHSSGLSPLGESWVLDSRGSRSAGGFFNSTWWGWHQDWREQPVVM